MIPSGSGITPVETGDSSESFLVGLLNGLLPFTDPLRFLEFALPVLGLITSNERLCQRVPDASVVGRVLKNLAAVFDYIRPLSLCCRDLDQLPACFQEMWIEPKSL